MHHTDIDLHVCRERRLRGRSEDGQSRQTVNLGKNLLTRLLSKSHPVLAFRYLGVYT
jgi:hypothetical protein